MSAQPVDVGQSAGVRIGRELIGEFGLAAALMSKREEIDHDPAGLFVRQALAQSVEGSPIALPRKQPVPIDQIEKRHWLAPQGMDHVPIIDDLIVLAIGMRSPARQGQEMRAADEHVEVIVVEPAPAAGGRSGAMAPCRTPCAG